MALKMTSCRIIARDFKPFALLVIGLLLSLLLGFVDESRYTLAYLRRAEDAAITVFLQS
jgi:hypothetical protein